MNYSIEGAKYGISFGTALAIAISYTTNQSILWAIIHGFFSWLYVIYFALFKFAPFSTPRLAVESGSRRVRGVG